MQWLRHLSCDFATEARSWFSASSLLTVIAPGTVSSFGQVILYHPSFSLVNFWVELDGRLLIAEI